MSLILLLQPTHLPRTTTCFTWSNEHIIQDSYRSWKTGKVVEFEMKISTPGTVIEFSIMHEKSWISKKKKEKRVSGIFPRKEEALDLLQKSASS